MSHPTRPRPADPYASKNPFLARSYRSKEIRNLSDALLKVPSPFLPFRPEWEEMYWRAWGMAWSNLRRPAPASGFISNFLNSIDSRNLLMWDAAFCTQYGLYGRRAFDFMGILDNFYSKQHGDGFICREISSENGLDLFHPFDPNSTGPNIMAWAEWRYYRLTGDDSRLGDVFWPLLALHHWTRSNRSWPNGLYWATGLSSGMFNQERVPEGEHHHRHWSWVDATMQAALNTKILAQMASAIGQNHLAEPLQQEHHDLVHVANDKMWSESLEFYQDVDPKGRYSEAKSIGAFWSLLDREMVPADRLSSFLSSLRKPEGFLRSHQVPALSAADPTNSLGSGDYWRGGVWSPTNFMLLDGLRTAGQQQLAHDIAANHLAHVCEVFEHTDTFWEYYQAESTSPGQGAKPHYVGWTGLSAISIFIEHVIGIQVDWPKRRVSWERRLATEDDYGIRNYPLGYKGTMSLVGNSELIKVTTTVPFTLIIRDQERRLQSVISEGETEIPTNWRS